MTLLSTPTYQLLTHLSMGNVRVDFVKATARAVIKLVIHVHGCRALVYNQQLCSYVVSYKRQNSKPSETCYTKFEH